MKAFTKRFEQTVSERGCRYVFYCDICGSGYITPLLEKAETKSRDAFANVQGEAKLRFNHCPACGRWVCDKDFVVERGQCVECSASR